MGWNNAGGWGGQGWGRAAAASGSAPYTYYGPDVANANLWNGSGDSNTIAYTLPSGSHKIIIATSSQNNPTSPSVTVNGTSLTQQVIHTGGGTVGNGNAAIFSGAVTLPGGSVSVVVTWTSSTFFDRGCYLWIADGITSTTAAASAQGGGTVSIAVQNGDIMFGASAASTNQTYSGSTVAPNNIRSAIPTGGSLYMIGTDWQIAATNASFSVAAGDDIAIATFR